MTKQYSNPHSADSLQHEFWEMCVRRDLEAFLKGEWSITADDFDAEDFFGIDANGSSNPCDWTPIFSTLEAYQKAFEQQVVEFFQKDYAVDPRDVLYNALVLSEPIIDGDRATIVKTFDGQLVLKDGSSEPLTWKSLFHLRKKSGRWRFTGFVGYLPLE